MLRAVEGRPASQTLLPSRGPPIMFTSCRPEACPLWLSFIVLSESSQGTCYGVPWWRVKFKSVDLISPNSTVMIRCSHLPTSTSHFLGLPWKFFLLCYILTVPCFTVQGMNVAVLSLLHLRPFPSPRPGMQ